jgi:hypothetical protein
MKKFPTKKFMGITGVVLLLMLSGCITILLVTQPSTAFVGEIITATMDVEMDETPGGPGGGPSYGLTALLIPTDWTVQSVEFDGDYGPESMTFLHPDSADRQPNAGVDFWHDSLIVHYPPPAGMDWVVYQGTEEHFWIGDTTHVTVTYEMTTGAAGTYDIGYFASTTDLSFEDPGYTDVSLGNQIVVGPSAIDEQTVPGIATRFALEQNYPNPFNPSTTIRYEIKKRSQVKLAVYDLTGRQVAVIANGVRNPGIYEVNFTADNLASGVYIYRLTAGEFVQSHKMALVR